MTLETNSQEGMKHQMRGATQAQQGMTLRITLIPPTSCPFDSCASSIVQFTGRFTTGCAPTLRNNWLQFHDRCMESDYKLLSSSLLSSCNPASFVALWAEQCFFTKKFVMLPHWWSSTSRFSHIWLWTDYESTNLLKSLCTTCIKCVEKWHSLRIFYQLFVILKQNIWKSNIYIYLF